MKGQKDNISSMAAVLDSRDYYYPHSGTIAPGAYLVLVEADTSLIRFLTITWQISATGLNVMWEHSGDGVNWDMISESNLYDLSGLWSRFCNWPWWRVRIYNDTAGAIDYEIWLAGYVVPIYEG